MSVLSLGAHAVFPSGLGRFRWQMLASGGINLGLGWMLALGLMSPVLAGPRPDARVQEILDGNELFIDDKQARVNQLAFRPEVIATKNSRGSIAFSSGAQARISKNTQLRLSGDCARLVKGQMLISGKQNTCVGSVRMSVRGTHYMVEVLEDGTTQVAALDGLMTFSPGTGVNGRPSVIPVGADREVIRFSQDGQVVERRCLISTDYRRYLEGDLVQGFFFPLPKVGQLVSMLTSSVPGAGQLLRLLRTGGNIGLIPFSLSPF